MISSLNGVTEGTYRVRTVHSEYVIDVAAKTATRTRVHDKASVLDVGHPGADSYEQINVEIGYPIYATRYAGNPTWVLHSTAVRDITRLDDDA